MNFTRVKQAIWLTRQTGRLNAQKLIETEELKFQCDGSIVGGRGYAIAVDDLIAREGELVLVCTGSKVRDVTIGPSIATKKVVIGIVDGFDVDIDAVPPSLIALCEKGSR